MNLRGELTLVSLDRGREVDMRLTEKGLRKVMLSIAAVNFSSCTYQHKTANHYSFKTLGLDIAHEPSLASFSSYHLPFIDYDFLKIGSTTKEKLC
jgi:hypothetical protein